MAVSNARKAGLLRTPSCGFKVDDKGHLIIQDSNGKEISRTDPASKGMAVRPTTPERSWTSKVLSATPANAAKTDKNAEVDKKSGSRAGSASSVKSQTSAKSKTSQKELRDKPKKVDLVEIPAYVDPTDPKECSPNHRLHLSFFKKFREII